MERSLIRVILIGLAALYVATACSTLLDRFVLPPTGDGTESVGHASGSTPAPAQRYLSPRRHLPMVREIAPAAPIMPVVETLSDFSESCPLLRERTALPLESLYYSDFSDRAPPPLS